MPTLYKNATSPFARLAHAALIARGVPGVEIRMADQWGDPEPLRAVNSAGRVPALALEDGTVISESLLIAAYADREGASGETLFSGPEALSLAGLGLGICDAAVQILVGRRIVAGDFSQNAFDENPIAERRRLAIAAGLKQLEEAAPRLDPRRIDVGTIAAVTAVDYANMRFGGADFVPQTPKLSAFAEEASAAAALAETGPPA